MIRAGAAAAPELLATTPATQVEMRGRPMTGWLDVAAEHLTSDEQLDAWVGRGIGFAANLPSK